MGRNLDREITRLRKNKHTALVLAFVAVLLMVFFMALPGTQATYGGAKNGTHVFVLSQDQDIRVNLKEDEWSVNKGMDMLPGTTLAKNPVVENQASDCYMRVNFRITEHEVGTIKTEDVTSATIDPTASADARARCEKILQMLWFDSGSNLEEGNSYSSAELEAMETAGKISNVFNSSDFEPEFENTDAALNGWNSDMKAYSFVYKSSNDNKFNKGTNARFFTNLIMPSDFSNTEMLQVGDFYINIWVQAIQAEGFNSREDAIDALSDANVENDMSRIDGETVSPISDHRVS